MKPEHVEIARRAHLLARLSPSVADALLANATLVETRRGTTLFSQDEPATAFYIVLDGWVKLYRVTVAGQEAVVNVCTRGYSFGHAAALRGGINPMFAEAVTNARLVKLGAKDLHPLVENHAELAVAMLAVTNAYMRGLVTQIEQLKGQTGVQRLANFLLDLAEPDGWARPVDLPYDKVLIAGRLGMSPESLSRAFARLKRHGVTTEQASVEIADVETLRSFAQRDRAVAWHNR